MGFRVLAPLAFVRGGKVIHYWKRGGVVTDIPEDVAARFVADGKLEPVEAVAPAQIQIGDGQADEPPKPRREPKPKDDGGA